MIEERFLPNFPPCCLGVALVSEIPFDNGQIVCRDGVDAKTLEVMSHAASFSDSLIGDARNPGTLNHQLQTSQELPASVTFIALPSTVGRRDFATGRLFQPTNP